jgi:hypothetical protein
MMADSAPPRYGNFPRCSPDFPRINRSISTAREPEWHEAHRSRRAEAEAVELADRLLGPTASHPDIPDSPARR